MKNNENNFSCIVCNFHTTNRFNYNKHMKTNKHLIKTGEKENPKFICSICSKSYTTKQSLWRHKQMCIKNTKDDENKIKILKLSNKSKKVVMDTTEYEKLMNLLREKDNLIREQAKTVYFVTNNNLTNNITNNNITNNITDNRQINNNIIVILNENYKESYNVNDWIKRIQVNLQQIVQCYMLNYSNTMSKLVSDNLYCVPLKQRPILCIENEIYYKNNNTWRKMTNNKIASYIIKNVAEYGRREYYKYSEDPNYSEYTIALDRCFNYFKKLDNDISKITDKIIVNVISCKDNVLCIV